MSDTKAREIRNRRASEIEMALYKLKKRSSELTSQIAAAESRIADDQKKKEDAETRLAALQGLIHSTQRLLAEEVEAG